MEFEIGQTWRTRSRELVAVVLVGKNRAVVKTENGDYYSVHSSGYVLPSGMGHHGDDLREQIVPSKLQLREGAWYKRKDGKVVGPCVKQQLDCCGHAWYCAGAPYVYFDNGQNRADTSIWLTEEVPDPTPKPVYRPFASAAEFDPYREKWVLSTKCNNRCRVSKYNDQQVGVSPDWLYWSVAFAFYTFEDGTPFGVRVS